MGSVNLFDAIYEAVEYCSHGVAFFFDFYNCLPAVVQAVLFSFLIATFGFAFIYKLLRLFVG